MVTRYLQTCNTLKIPVNVVKHDTAELVVLRNDVMDTVKVLWAAILFDQWRRGEPPDPHWPMEHIEPPEPPDPP